MSLPLTSPSLQNLVIPEALPVSEITDRKVSIVVPAYNDLAAVILCLKSLVATAGAAGMAGRLEILVQDDASPDVDLTTILGPPAQVARNKVNLGFAANCNMGAQRADRASDILFFLNQDTQAQSDWFEPLVRMFADPRVGIVGPKLIFADDKKESVQSCGGLYDGGKGPFHRYLGYAADDWRVNIAEKVSWTTGAALAIRQTLFWAVNGFDPAYGRGYFEDVDLCEKVKARGYEVWYCPEAVFKHEVGTSSAATQESFRENSIRFHNKWNYRIVPDTPIVHVNY